MSSLKLKIKKPSGVIDNPIFILFCIIPHMEPRALYELAEMNPRGVLYEIDQIFNIWKVVSMIVLLFVYFFVLRKLTFIMASIIIFQLCIVFSTLNNNGDIIYLAKIIAPIIGLCMLTEVYVKRNSVNIFLKTFYCLLSFLVVLNFLTLILYPEGMYDRFVGARMTTGNWFLGYYNAHIFTFLPTIGIGALINVKGRKLKTNFKIILFIICLSTWMNTSKTSLVVIVFIVTLILFYSPINVPKFINIYTYLAGSLTLTYLIIFYKVQEKFSYFIEEVLGRNLTFTGRTNIWDSAIYYIKQKQWLGYGLDSKVASTHFWSRVTQAHNHYLDLIYMIGIIGFILFLILLYISLNKLYIYKNDIPAKILSFTFLGYFILYITEAKRNENTLFFILLVLAYYIPLYQKENIHG